MMLRVPFKFRENTFNSLYLDITFPVIRFDYQNPFIYATMTNPETGSTYRFTFLSPIPIHNHSLSPTPISLTKRNQKIINIKKKIDTKIVPYIKAYNIKSQKVAIDDLYIYSRDIIENEQDLEPFIRLGRLQLSHKSVLFYIALAVFRELSRYFNYTPSLPNITFYQYSIIEHKIEIGFLLYDFNIYTKYVFDDESIKILPELDYREIYFLSNNTVSDLYFLAYYYFWFYLNYGIEFWSAELIDNKDGLRIKFGGKAWNSIHGVYKRFLSDIWNILHTYYLDFGVHSKK